MEAAYWSADALGVVGLYLLWRIVRQLAQLNETIRGPNSPRDRFAIALSAVNQHDKEFAYWASRLVRTGDGMKAGIEQISRKLEVLAVQQRQVSGNVITGR